MCKYYTNVTFSPSHFGGKKRKKKKKKQGATRSLFLRLLRKHRGFFHSWLHHLPAGAVHQYTPDGGERTSQDTAVKQSQS